jgi:glucoamylase
MPLERPAPGWPGIPARWTSSAKSGVGTAVEATSRVWFTISHGILNEIYYPRVDQACTRDFGLIVTDGKSFFSEEKRDARSEIRTAADGVPAFAIESTCLQGRYKIEKLVVSDPGRDVILQCVAFHALQGQLSDYRLYALLAPHLVNRGANNSAWVADYKGLPMLFAEGTGAALALGSSAPFNARSVGFVGFSDGWQDLSRHFELRWRYDHAHDGNVALTGGIDLEACEGRFVLALGFGRRAEEAAFRVRASLSDGIEQATRAYVAGWRRWQDSLLPLDRTSRSTGHNTYRISTAVLRCHEARSFRGGYIASLSVPWGFAKGDEDLGGYHLIWPRDLVEIAGGLLAVGAKEAARDVVYYLQTIQEPDGHWPQNCWLDGGPYWTGIQMDECAFPILLVDLMWR